MLKHRADLQTLAYMLAATVLLPLQWLQPGFSWPLYLLTLALAFATGIMNHNHCHCPMWRSRRINAVTDCWFTLFQGHPGFVFHLCHERNHHRHRNRDADWTRTWRYRDDNCLIGFIRHPFESVMTLRPHIAAHLGALRRTDPESWRRICLHYLLLFGFVAGALALDPFKALIYVVVPQLASLFFLLGANYLQHAHTDECSQAAHSRNFLGLVNPLFFNIGLHSAHHLSGSLHWSALPALHRRIVHRIDPRALEPGLGWYLLRVFLLAPLVPAFRSQTLRRSHGGGRG